VDVIDEAWQELQEKLTQLDDYLQLMEAHDAFLARISMHAMIDNEKVSDSLTFSKKIKY
jgi:Gamma tubulin complex component C-terminal